MKALSAADFDAFFGALYRDADGRPLEPFPWQRRLVRRVLGEGGRPPGWPQVLALPTASGKTAAIDVAVFTLACQADAPAGTRTAPRRIFFVVDRRIIVDEAFERARVLAERLREAEGGILRRVADGLRALAGGDSPPLEIFELRGGIYRDDAWARTPLQPTVVASTVDQVGSRLLYRGYGVSPRSWPIHAGLAAHDALVILDEAHCARPFTETLEAVARYREWAEEPLAVPFHHVLMTATPRPGAVADEVFELADEDREHPELGRRLSAGKPAHLLPEVPGRAGSNRLVDSLCEQADTFAEAGARRIAILVNRVSTARRVHERLDERRGEKVLMIGRMRPRDRDRLIGAWRPFLAAGPGRKPHDRPIFVVATQCLEVGADLDFDAMVTECASLDALRQRFGRLNRLGRPDERARAAVVVTADDLKAGREDFVYGGALRETWDWLTANAMEHDGGPAVDFGIDALDAVWDKSAERDPDLRTRLSAPAPSAPVMLPAHLDQWVQTAPVPSVEPDVSLFLHGAERGAPDVQVCWRRDLEVPPEGHPDSHGLLPRWTQTVALLPPSSPECMPVPLHVVARWLRGEERPAEELTDVEGSTSRPEAEVEGDVPVSPKRIVLRWRGPEDSSLVGLGERPRPGDTLVIPVELGGWEEFGHIPPGFPVDVAEEANFERRRRPVLRLHPALLEEWPESTARGELLELARWDDATAEEEGPEDAAGGWLAKLTDEDTPKTLREVRRTLARGDFKAVRHPSDRGWILRGRSVVTGRVAAASRALGSSGFAMAETFTTDDDSASATADVPLERHCDGVAELAGLFGHRAGLPAALADDLRVVGRLHDLGKADPRFQAWLHGGNRLAAQLAPYPLAKSRRLPDDRRHQDRARRRAGYPSGSRHEMLSVVLVESAPRLLDGVADRDLVLHLIASHHGRCRPLAPVVPDDDPVEVRYAHAGAALAASSATGLERIDSGVAERFWRLVRRYGWWGLALLEAIVRLADHRRSEVEERRDGEALGVARRSA